MAKKFVLLITAQKFVTIKYTVGVQRSALHTASSPEVICDSLDRARAIATQYFPGIEFKVGSVCGEHHYASDEIDDVTYYLDISPREMILPDEHLPGLPFKFKRVDHLAD